MRRKTLTGIAHGIVGSFVSRNNDIGGYWAIGKLSLLTQKHGRLLNLSLYPQKNYENEMQAVALYYSALLRRLMDKAEVGMHLINSATVSIRFGTFGALPDPPLTSFGEPFVCTVTITDVFGRDWSASSAGRCYPHNPLKESKSTRI